MDYWFYLPPELVPFFRRLTQTELEDLDLDSFSLKRTSFNNLVEYMYNQLIKLTKRRSLSGSELQLLSFCGVLLGKPEDPYEKLIMYIENEDDPENYLLLWYIKLHSLIIDQNRSMHDTVIAKYQQNPNLSHLVSAAIVFFDLTGSTDVLIEDIKYFMNKNHQFIMDNLHSYVEYLSVLSPPLQSIPKISIELYQPLHYFIKQHNYPFLKARADHALANFYLASGATQKAIDLWELSLDTYKQMDLQSQYSIYHNLALLNLQIENYSKAEKYILKAKEGSQFYSTGYILSNIYQRQGKLDEAINAAEKMVSAENPFNLYQRVLAELYYEKARVEDAEEMERQAEMIYNKNQIPPNLVNLKLLKAAKQSFYGNYLSAKKLYQELVTRSIENEAYRELLMTFPKLVELQFDLIRLKPDNTHYQIELENTIEDMLFLANEEGFATASIKILMLKSQLYILRGEINEAKKIVYNAAKLADQFGYQKLQEKAEKEMRTLDDQLTEDEEGIFGKVQSIVKSLFSGLSKPIKKKEYEIFGVMTLTDFGTSIYSNYISDKLQSEPNLISGLITAIKSFMKEVTQSEGVLQTIQHQDMAIMLEPVADDFLTVCISSSETLDLRNKVRVFSSELQNVVGEYEESLSDGNVTQEFTKNVDKLVNTILVSG